VDSESLEIHMHALRTINPGEEMTISCEQTFPVQVTSRHFGHVTHQFFFLLPDRDMAQIREQRQEDISHYGFQWLVAVDEYVIPLPGSPRFLLLILFTKCLNYLC
jgi:hypothetical protein